MAIASPFTSHVKHEKTPLSVFTDAEAIESSWKQHCTFWLPGCSVTPSSP